MKIQYENQDVFELSEIKKKVILNDIPSSVFASDMTRRCKYWIEMPIDKFAHANKNLIERVINQRGLANVPLKNEKSLAKLAELELDSKKLEDVVSPCVCRVGEQQFEVSLDHRKAWRYVLHILNKQKNIEVLRAEESKIYKERMSWIIQHKYERCFERIKLQWLPKLEARGINEIPADPDEFAELVFSQPDYKDRDARDAEELEKNNE